ELREELGIQAEIGEFLGSSRYDYAQLEVELLVFRVSSFRGRIRLYDHEEMRWVLPEELPHYDFPEADKPIIRKLLGREFDS
ncbi:MAG: NUDIX domain-containing protein, partial [bacterium]